MNRLETLAPDLVQQLRQAAPENRRAAAIAAAEFALFTTNLQHAALEKAMDTLRAAGELSIVQQAELKGLVSSLDRQYLERQKAADEGHASAAD